MIFEMPLPPDTASQFIKRRVAAYARVEELILFIDSYMNSFVSIISIPLLI
jgi:hypothetical protein